jgi:hypothetical protein
MLNISEGTPKFKNNVLKRCYNFYMTYFLLYIGMYIPM